MRRWANNKSGKRKEKRREKGKKKKERFIIKLCEKEKLV